jgi:hypothetical protein
MAESNLKPPVTPGFSLEPDEEKCKGALALMENLLRIGD